MPYWAAFNNQSYIKELTVGNAWVSLGYSNDLFQAQQDALKAKRPFKLNFSLQQEGNTLSMDNLVILKDARARIWRTSSSTSCWMARTPPS